MMDRKEQLISIVCKDGSGNEGMLLPLIEKVVFLEKQLEEVEQLPFYKVNPSNKQQQKMLPAFRIYKELLQQYTNCIKVLSSASGDDGESEESPLRKWVNGRLNANK